MNIHLFITKKGVSKNRLNWGLFNTEIRTAIFFTKKTKTFLNIIVLQLNKII